MIVTMRHLRTIPGFSKDPGFCSSGGRAFFTRYNLDWSNFLRNGIDSELLLNTGDALAKALVDHAAKEIADGR